MATEQMRVDKGVSRLSREVGQSPSVVSRKLLQGRSPDDIRREAEVYRAEQAERAAQESGDDETYQQARARKERAIADLRELEVTEKEGKLIERSQVAADAFKIARVVRDSLLAVPDRMASLLAAETDAARVHDLLTTEIRKALSMLADTVAEASDV